MGPSGTSLIWHGNTTFTAAVITDDGLPLLANVKSFDLSKPFDSVEKALMVGTFDIHFVPDVPVTIVSVVVTDSQGWEATSAFSGPVACVGNTDVNITIKVEVT